MSDRIRLSSKRKQFDASDSELNKRKKSQLSESAFGNGPNEAAGPPNDNLGQEIRNLDIFKEPRPLTDRGPNTGRSDGESGDKSGNNTEKVDKNKLMSLFTDCMTALSSNKICTYNAFDIGIIDHIDDLLLLKNEEAEGKEGEEDKNEICFSTASKVVESASKIYGYRVEAIYDKTFNILMNIQNNNNPGNNAKIGNKKNKKKLYEFTGSNTLLSKNEVTLSLLPVESLLMDPFFLKISSLFDQFGPQGLLLNNILISNSNLQLVLSSSSDNKDGDTSKDNTGVSSENSLRNADNSPNVNPFMDVGNNYTKGDFSTSNNNNMSIVNDSKEDKEGQLLENHRANRDFEGVEEKLNRELLSKIAGEDYESLRILPELESYFKSNKYDSLIDFNHHFSSHLEDKTIPSDNHPEDSRHLEDNKVPDNNLEDNSQVELEDKVDTEEADNADFYDVFETEEELREKNWEAGPEFEIDRGGTSLNFVNRINFMNLNNEMSYYEDLDQVRRKLSPRAKSATRERKARPKMNKDLRSYVFNSNLSDELDSVELLPNFIDNKALKNYSDILGSFTNLQGGARAPNTADHAYRINLDDLLHSYNIYLNLGVNALNASSRRNSLTLDRGFLDFPEAPDDSFEPLGEQLNGQAEEVEANNFVDVLKLKNYIIDFLNQNSSDDKSLNFNELVCHIHKKFNKNVVTIHILFVCLLHVCNEFNLLLEPFPEDSPQNLQNADKKGGFKIKFDSVV